MNGRREEKAHTMAGKAGRGREGFGFVFNSNYHSKEYILQEEVEDVPVDKIHNVRKQCLPQKDPELLPNLCFSLKQKRHLRVVTVVLAHLCSRTTLPGPSPQYKVRKWLYGIINEGYATQSYCCYLPCLMHASPRPVPIHQTDKGALKGSAPVSAK